MRKLPTGTTFAVAVTTAIILLSFTSTIKKANAASIGKDKVPANLQERLHQLRQLSKEAGLPQTSLNEDVCLTEGCLDAAYDLLSALNGSVNPCDDFFQFSCGRWIEKNPPPPADYASNHFLRLIYKVSDITQELLTEEEDPDDALPINLAKRYYKDCVDLEAIERVGMEPLQQLLTTVFGNWQLLNPQEWDGSAFDWISLAANTRRRTFASPIVNLYVYMDLKQNSRQIIYLDQPDLVLPRLILIDPENENYTALFTAYENYIVEVAQELNSTQSEEELRREAKAMIEFESKLAKISKSDEERYDMERLYNQYKLQDYQAETDAIDERGDFTISWKKYLDQLFLTTGVAIGDEEPIIVSEPDYIKNLIPILKEESEKKTTLANYIVWRLVAATAGESTEAMRNITFRFRQAMTGATEEDKREGMCAFRTNYFFGMATSVKYIEAEFDEESKHEMNRMIVNLKASFQEIVTEADWMEDATREKALEKAEAMGSLMAYPDWLDDKAAIEKYYENVELGSSHFDSQFKLGLSASDKQLKALRSPTDRDYWMLTPVDVNAVHLTTLNKILFPAAILQPPFFGGNRPKHQNYGGVGAVIGHEIIHGFDNRGSLFDKEGNLQNWWDERTKAEFQKRGECMVDQYGKYYVEAVGMYVNGVLTLPENIGDNGGLGHSYRAYQKYVEANGAELRLPGLEHLSPEQLYFMGWANVWCESITIQGLVRQILTDPHSPSEFRVNGPMRNSEDFAKAYNCPVDSGMNPPAEEKCPVW